MRQSAPETLEAALYRGVSRYEAERRHVFARAWLLAIVRNTAFTWLKKNRPQTMVPLDDDDLAGIEDPAGQGVAFHNADLPVLRAALGELPVEFREALVLRELEGLSYKEIAAIAEVPLGTVMSRLARARRQLQTLIHQKGDVRT